MPRADKVSQLYLTTRLIPYAPFHSLPNRKWRQFPGVVHCRVVSFLCWSAHCWAARRILASNSAAQIAVVPSDHFVRAESTLTQSLQDAVTRVAMRPDDMLPLGSLLSLLHGVVATLEAGCLCT